MRGLTIAIVAGAIALIIGIAVYMQRSAAPEPTAGSVAAAGKAGADKQGGRSARVEDRLSQLRQDYDRKQGGEMGQPLGQPVPKQRGVPTASARAAQAPVPDIKSDDDEDEDEDPEEIEKLKTTLFKDPDPDERIGAVLMLTGDEGPESLRILIEAMNDPDAEVRLAVVEAIGDRSDDIHPATLTPALADPDPEVRFEAISILGDMDDSPEALAMVRQAVDDPDEDVRALAEGILDFAEDDNEPPQQQQPHPTAQRK